MNEYIKKYLCIEVGYQCNFLHMFHEKNMKLLQANWIRNEIKNLLYMKEYTFIKN